MTSSIADNAIQEALESIAAEGQESLPGMAVRLKLSRRFAGMVEHLCATLGLSVQTAYNSALKYAIHVSVVRRVAVASLAEYPQRLRGTDDSYEMSVTTVSQVLKAKARGDFDVARATLAGITLLYSRVYMPKPVGRPRKVAVAQ
jgi:hypothetical protein